MSKITSIAYSQDLSQSKYDHLEFIAQEAGLIRADVWRRYGSINGVGKSFYDIRAEHKPIRTDSLPYKIYEATLKNVVGDIALYREAAKRNVRQHIWRNVTDEGERKELFTLLKYDKWLANDYLRRLMRKYYKHGKTTVNNQILLSPNDYKTFTLNEGGNAWIKVQSRVRGQRIAIPLNTTWEPSGTIRIILRDGRAEIHWMTDAPEAKPAGDKTVGIDKGYTEVYKDSDGDIYGEGLGDILTKESDHNKVKNQRRNRLRSIATQSRSKRKRSNIIKYNLGTKKRDRRKKRHQAKVKKLVRTATNQVLDKAGTIAHEDLTSPIKSKRSFGKNQNRRLNGWTKGVMADAIDELSKRRGASAISVNSAYTSQVDHRHGVLLGNRQGDRFTAYDGEVLDADVNAAINIRNRMSDSEIGLYTPYQEVKTILLKRTRAFEQTDVFKQVVYGPNLDSSYVQLALWSDDIN